MIYCDGKAVEVRYHFWRHKNGISTHMVGLQVFAMPEGWEAPLTDLSATGGAEEIQQAVATAFEAALDDLDLMDWNLDDEEDDSYDIQQHCDCQYCNCINKTEYGVTCAACLSGAHQG